MDGGFGQECHAMGFPQQANQYWQSRARFDAKLMRTDKSADRVIRRDFWVKPAELGRVEPPATFAHLGVQESLDDRDGFGASHGDDKASLLDRDAGLKGCFFPDIARAPRQRPVFAALLPGDGYEPEIPNRCAVRARIAVDHHHPLAQLGRRQRVRESDDSGADDR
jgi:hypothetical protein